MRLGPGTQPSVRPHCLSTTGGGTLRGMPRFQDHSFGLAPLILRCPSLRFPAFSWASQYPSTRCSFFLCLHCQRQARIDDAPGFMSLRIRSMAIRRDARVGDRMQLHGMSPLWRALGIRLRGRRNPRLGHNQGLRSRRLPRVSLLSRVRLCRLLARIGAEQGRPPPHCGEPAPDGTRTHRSPSDRPLRRIGQMGGPATGRTMYPRPLVLAAPLRAMRPVT